MWLFLCACSCTGFQAHDWSLALRGGGDGGDADDFDEEFGGMDAVDTVAEDNAAGQDEDHQNTDEKQKEGEKEHVPIREKIAEVEAEGFTREELEKWLIEKMTELHKAKKLPVHGLSWSDSGSPQERQAIMRMGFIFLTYHPTVWWFEIVVMMQKLIMTAGVIFIFQGTAIQIASAFSVTFGFLIIVLWYRPLVNARLLQLQVFSLVITCLTLFMGLMKMAPDAFQQALVWSLHVCTLDIPCERMRARASLDPILYALDRMPENLRLMHVLASIRSRRETVATTVSLNSLCLP